MHRQVVTDEGERLPADIKQDYLGFWDEPQNMSSHSPSERAGGLRAFFQEVLLLGWEAIRNPLRFAGMLGLLLRFLSHTQQRCFFASKEGKKENINY